MSGARYAIYAAPRPDEALWHFGCSLLGYDATMQSDVPLVELSGFAPALWRHLTEEPRRYGFHATLKAPFYLAEGRDEGELQQAVEGFCERHQALPPFALIISRLGPFFALIPKAENHALQGLAGDVVEVLDAFRAPLSFEDMARRKPEQLPERERAYLARWGYPYVFDAFRFHMTLTGRVPIERREAVEASLKAAYAALPPEPFFLADLVVFKQSTRESPFFVLSRHAFKR